MLVGAGTDQRSEVSKPLLCMEHLIGHDESSVLLLYVINHCKEKMIIYPKCLYLAANTNQRLSLLLVPGFS